MPAAAGHLPDIEVRKITEILDYMNIMTWDLHGSWGPISNHNSALYGPAQGDSTRCLDGAFRLYHDEHGVPAQKINLAAAFYGHTFMQCNEMYGEHAGADTSLFKSANGVTYAQIVAEMDRFERKWDAKAQAPYMVSDSLGMLISLDDEESVARKANYIEQNNARGLVIWPLMGDYLPGGRTPLLDVISRELMNRD
jgi:chitinase